MSLKDDHLLLQNYRNLQKAGTMEVTIHHDQIVQIVVSDLLNKYKATEKDLNTQSTRYKNMNIVTNISANKKTALLESIVEKTRVKDAFETVLRYYLSDDEFDEAINL